MKNFFIVFFLFLSVQLFAQERVFDVVYMKSGVEVKGIITELTPGNSLTIITTNGKTLTILLSEVGRIGKENFDTDDFLKKPRVDSSSAYTHRFINITKVGLVRNISDYKNNITASNITAYQFRNISIGLGVSYIKYKDKNYTIPVYADVRYTFEYPKWKPFFYVDLGHSVSDEKGKGVYFQTGTGVKFNIKNNLHLVLDAGYSYQKVAYNVELTNTSYRIVEYRDNLHLTAGIQF